MPEGDERGSSADAHTYGTHHGSACVRQQAHLGVPLTFQLDSPGLCVIFAFYYTAPGIWYKHSPSTKYPGDLPEFTGQRNCPPTHRGPKCMK